METALGKFRLAHAGGGDWETLTRDCLDQLDKEMGGEKISANLGFLYVTDELSEDFDNIWRLLRTETGIEDWVGTVGLGVCGGGVEYFDTPAISLLCCAMPEDSYRILPNITRPGDPLPIELADWAEANEPLVGVVHGDPRNPYLPSIIDALGDEAECHLVGGLTASHTKFQQLAGELTEGGLSGVLFSSNLPTLSGLTQGCTPIGKIHKVTASHDHILLELDGRPALDVFKDDIGEVLARNLERVGGYIHAALPVSSDSEGNQVKGDYLVRNIMGIETDNNSLSIGERLTPGDRLMFVRRDAPSAEEDLDRMLDDIVVRAEDIPRAALYFTCVARGPNLFGQESEELLAVADALGEEVPVIGFFANGEISDNRLYGYTGVLTLIL
jgi:small ligand-binding sensory domain FIST